MLSFVATKKAILNLRLKPEVREEFAIAADLRGASMSGLIHQFIVRTIREEKELYPQAFKTERPVNGKIPEAKEATLTESDSVIVPVQKAGTIGDRQKAKRKAK